MNEATQSSKKQRLKEELIKYWLICAYLYVCFTILALYKAAALETEGISWAPYGFALVQALILGKFIMIGDAISVGRHADDHPLAHRIVWKALATLALLVVFKILEELFVAWRHDTPLNTLWTEFVERPLWVSLAPVLIMLLVLIPLVAFTEIYRAMGHEQFRDHLLKHRPGDR